MKCKVITKRGLLCSKNAVKDGRCYQHHEMHVAIKKDKALIAELRAEITALKVAQLLSASLYSEQIAELKSAYQHTVEDNVDLVAQLDAVKKIIDRLETLPQDTLYSHGIAHEFRSALEQGNA